MWERSTSSIIRLTAAALVRDCGRSIRSVPPLAQDDRPLDDVAQLADVARPLEAPELRQAVILDRVDPLPDLARDLVDDGSRQQREVLGPLAQGWDHHWEDRQAEVEVGPELAVGHRLLDVAVGCRDDPDVRPHAAGTPEALEDAVLQDAQELRLEVERQLADLVEEERRAVRELEPPHLPAEGAGVRALLAPEQLGFDQRGRQRRAVHLHQGPVGPGAPRVNLLGDELLANAGLSHEQHRRVGRCNPLDERQQPLQRRPLSHEPVRPGRAPRLLPEIRVLPLKALAQIAHLVERGVEPLIRMPARQDARDHLRHRAQSVEHCRRPDTLGQHRAECQYAEHLATGPEGKRCIRLRPETPHQGLVDLGFLGEIVDPGKDQVPAGHHARKRPGQLTLSHHLWKWVQPGPCPGVRHHEIVAGALKERAPIETERLDDAAQALLDRQVHPGGIQIDEARRQVDDQRLETETLRLRRPPARSL